MSTKQDRRIEKALDKYVTTGVDQLTDIVAETLGALVPGGAPLLDAVGDEADPKIAEVVRGLLLDFADAIGIDTATVRLTTQGPVTIRRRQG